MKKIKSLICLVILTITGSYQAQDIHFSQVYETPLFMSPANTGFYNGYVRAIANYRNQWSSMNNAFQTMAVSIDGGLFRSKKKPAFMGLGLTIFNDQAGVARLRQTNVLLNVSGLVKLGKNSALSVGLAGGAAATNLNHMDLTYESQFNGNGIDPATFSGETPYRQYTTVDVATGVAYEFSKVKKDQDHDDFTSFKISFGAFHLNRPEQNFGPGSNYRLPVRYVYSFTSMFDLEDTKFTLMPTAVFQTQGKAQSLVLGSYVKYRMGTGTKVTGEKTKNALGVGIFYRRKDALIPKLIFDLGDYSFGLAYDANLSGYRSASNGFGGFEISLRYNNLANSLFESRKEYK
jgi:type IX secretion system PorP/SprF family membrane protein